MKNKKDVILSFLFYGIGLLAFLIADLFVTAKFSKENIAQWAFVKSTTLIIGTVCMLGYDQVFVRDQSLIKRVLKKFLIQAVLIDLVICIIIHFVKDYSFEKTILIFLCIFLYAVLNYFCAAARACYNLWKSQFYNNSWKIFLLLILLMLITENALFLYISALLLGVAFVFFINGLSPKEENKTDNFIENKEAKRIGFAFLLTNVTLILAVYGEQFLINLYGSVSVSVHLFKYFSIFTPIALSVNGFLGFYYGPKIRKQGVMTIPSYIKFSRNTLLFSILITLLSTGLGIIYLLYFSEILLVDIDYTLIILLSILCVIRGLYTTNSVCLGIYADVRSLRKVALFFWISTIIYIILIFVILTNTTGIFAAQLISGASVFNWLSRLIISNKFTISTLKAAQNAGGKQE